MNIPVIHSTTPAGGDGATTSSVASKLASKVKATISLCGGKAEQAKEKMSNFASLKSSVDSGAERLGDKVGEFIGKGIKHLAKGVTLVSLATLGVALSPFVISYMGGVAAKKKIGEWQDSRALDRMDRTERRATKMLERHGVEEAVKIAEGRGLPYLANMIKQMAADGHVGVSSNATDDPNKSARQPSTSDGSAPPPLINLTATATAAAATAAAPGIAVASPSALGSAPSSAPPPEDDPNKSARHQPSAPPSGQQTVSAGGGDDSIRSSS